MPHDLTHFSTQHRTDECPDTREKPYLCRCGAAFTRRDLLTRHWRITQHAGDANITEARPSPDIVTIDSPQIPNSLHVPNIASNELHVNGTGEANGHLLVQLTQDDGDNQAPVAPFQDAHTQVIDPGKRLSISIILREESGVIDMTPGLHEITYHDDGFDEFRDFVNFIDGVGSSAQWTPEYDFDWMRFGLHHQESRRHSQEPEDRHLSAPEDIGTPFSTWLPSAPADDQVHLASNVGDGKLDLHTRLLAKHC